MTFDSPKTSVVLWYPCEGLGPGPPADTKFHGCSSPLYKIVQNNAYSWPFVDSQAQVENTVSDQQLVKFEDAKSSDTEG